MEEVEEKMRRLKVPKHFSKLPVLIHVCGAEDEILESEYFSHIIDFGSLLETQVNTT